MSYTKVTDFASKDALLSGNPAKLVKGVEIDDEFNAIQVADANNVKTADIGVTVQAYSANLAEYAAVNPTAAGLALLDDVDAAAQRTTLGAQAYSANLDEYAAVNPTAAGLALLDDADASAQRTTLGLVIGTDVQAYVAPSTSGNVLTSNGSAWTSAAPASAGGSSFKNKIIGGDFTTNPWQRGTSFTSATTPANSDDTYLADRWFVLSDGNDIVDVTRSTDAPTGAIYSIALDVETTNKKFGIAQIIEYANSAPLIGDVCSLSFKAKVSATTKLDNVKAAVIAWSGTADSVTSDIISAWGTEGTNPTLIANATYENTPANLNVTTSWADFSIENISIDTASTKNLIVFIWSDVTDTTAGDFLYLDQIQLEPGSVDTPFETVDVGTVKNLCYRYYYRMFPAAVNGVFAPCYSFATTGAQATGNFPVTMRTAPSALEQSGTANQYAVIQGSAAAVVCSSVPTHAAATTAESWAVNVTVASGLTAGWGGILRTDATNGASAYLGWGAEL